MEIPALIEVLHRLLAERDAHELNELIENLHPAVIVEGLDEFSDEEVGVLIELAEVHRGANIFAFLPEERQMRVFQAMTPSQQTDLITYLAHDERADLLEALPVPTYESILKKIAQKEREDIRQLEEYEEGTIGSIMTSDYVALPIESTAGESIERLRRQAPDAETIYYAYVLNADRHPVGVVSLKQLILARPDEPLDEVMSHIVIHLQAGAPVGEAVNELGRTGLLALPVVDAQERMAGIVTYDDVAEAAEDINTDDFHRLAAAPGAGTLNISSASLFQLLLKRLPWLLVLVFVNIFSGAGIAYFEDTIAAMVALVFFLPLLIDSGGNAGAQAATLMVRALAIGDLKLRDWSRFFLKEIGISLLMGLAMGAAVSLVAAFRAPEVMVVVSLTMMLTVMAGSLIGMTLPFLLTKVKLDPATASAPLITSMADISGVLIYFSIASWWLGR